METKPVRRHSIKRISGWSGFLALALFLALGVLYLPTLLNLDQFRPDFIDLLEKTFHCRAEIGHVRAELVPSPGLYVGRMALLDTQSAEILASGSLHVSLSWKSLLRGRLIFTSIRFTRPRFIVHRELGAAGQARWVSLAFPQSSTSDSNADVERLDIRSGSLEVWDHATYPATRWVVSDLTGNLQMRAQQGALTGHVLFLGRQSVLDIHYQGHAAYPVQAHLTDVSLAALQSILRTQIPALEGTAEVTVRARWDPTLDIRADIEQLVLKHLDGVHMKGAVVFTNTHLDAHLETLTPTPMLLRLQGAFPSSGWDLQGDLHGYNANIIRKLYEQFWVNRLDGAGSLSFAVQSRRRAGPVGPSGMAPVWTWSAEGHDFRLAETAIRVPEWSGQGDARTSVIDVRTTTAQGGMGEVVWEKPSVARDASLTVDLTSVTIHQILEIFHLQSTSAYEAWCLDRASLEALLHPNGVFEVQDSDIDTMGMHVDLAGTFGPSPSSAPAHIQGDVLHIPLETVVGSFTGPPAPVTGTAQADFNLTFPLSAQWLRGFSGDVQWTSINGVVRSFKTFYRIMSVLNLTNYFQLRMPQVTAEGIVFQTLNGHLHFQNGLLSTEDLFLKSPNLNVGVNGAVDLIEKRIDTTLRVELFRFLEEVLKTVPITHWIFKKPNKIFLPLVVKVKGPLDNPNVD